MRVYFTIGGQFHGDVTCGQMLKQIYEHRQIVVQRALLEMPPGLQACDYCGDRAETVELEEELGLRKLGFIEKLRLLFIR